MCVANSARSQLAEGLARKILGKGFQVESAGSNPTKLNPYAIQVMQEVGVDISKHYSKSISDLDPNFIDQLNYIITLCAEEVCPVLPSKTAHKLHWPFTDPASKEPIDDEVALENFRTARDNIAEKIREFKVKNSL